MMGDGEWVMAFVYGSANISVRWVDQCPWLHEHVTALVEAFRVMRFAKRILSTGQPGHVHLKFYILILSRSKTETAYHVNINICSNRNSGGHRVHI